MCHCFGEGGQNKIFIFKFINIRHTKHVKVMLQLCKFCIIYQFDFWAIKLQEKIDKIQKKKFAK